MGDLRVPDLNVVYIAGRLTRDPDLQYTSSGNAYCKGSVANSRFFKKNGNREEETTFVDFIVWGQSAEFVGEKLRKGRAVLVEGKLRSEQWEDRGTGQKRSKVLVQARRVAPLEWDGNDQKQSSPAPRAIEEPIPDDDIPF